MKGLYAVLTFLVGTIPAGVGQAQTPDLAGSYYHFSLAKMHELRQEYNQAITEFEKAISLNPDSAELKVEFADTLWKAGEVRRAVEESEKSIKLDPGSSAPHFLLGKIYSSVRGEQQDNMLRKAAQAFRQAAELDPEHFEALYNLASIAWMQEDYHTVTSTLERFLELRPWVAEAYELKARAHVELNETDRAIQTLEESLNFDETRAANVKLLGELYLGQKAEDEAIELYQRFLESDADPDIQYRVALLLNEKRRFGEAVPLLRELVEGFPSHTQIKLALGQALKGNKRYAEAVEVFQEVLKVDASQFRANFELAESLTLLGRREEALERFRRLLENADSDQNRTLIETSMAFLYQDLRQYDKAIALFRGILTRNAEDDMAALRLAYTLKDAGQIQEALVLSDRLYDKYRNESFEDRANKPYVVIARAQVLSSANRLEEAIKLLYGEIARSTDPEQLLLAASQLYMDHKKYQKAGEVIQEGLSRYPDSEKMEFQLGAVYERQGNLAEAESVFRKVLEKNPEHAGVLNYLGYMLADQGIRLQEALGHILKAIDMDPHNGAYLDSLGWVYFRLDQLEPAERYLREAIRISSGDSTVYDHLGDLYSKLEQYDTAREYYRQSIAFATEQEEREKVQKKLDQLEVLSSQKRR